MGADRSVSDKTLLEEFTEDFSRILERHCRGLDVYFSSIEANIAFKEEFLKSDKDLEDAKHLRIIYSEKLDESEIRKIKELIKKRRR